MTNPMFPVEPQRGSGPFASGGPGGPPRVVLVGDLSGGPASSPTSLRGYLLIRALASSVVSVVQWSAVAMLVTAVLCWLAGVHWLAVLVGLVALVVLAVRALAVSLARRLSGADRLGSAEAAVAVMVSRTRRGLRRELRRVGLPSAPWAPLTVLLRLIRPTRRVATVQALGRIDLAAVVPPDQLDELHLLLQSGPGH